VFDGQLNILMKVTILNQEHNIKLYDWSHAIDQSHNTEICRVTDQLIASGDVTALGNPLYTTNGDPFEDRPEEIWKIMKETFHTSCADYIGRPFKVCSTQSRVTRMSYDPDVDAIELWHNHTLEPIDSLGITGVWFVHAPDELILTNRTGTEFAFNWPDMSETVFIGPYNLSWIIFPNYLWHAPGELHLTLPRYVMSADLEYMLL
jgi:hypothetical protein